MPSIAKKRLTCFLLLLLLLTALYARQGKFIGALSPAEDGHFVLIIDAGHGGADGGAVSCTGVKESEINLQIARRAELLTTFFGIACDMTRASEQLEYPAQADSIREKKVYDTRRRVEQINGTENAAVLSIHQNNFPSQSVRGAQTLYAPTAGSRELAEQMQTSFIRNLGTGDGRSAAQISGEVYILNHIGCPAVLAECGFLSNAEEEAKLRDGGYQIKLALTMTCTISAWMPAEGGNGI